MGRRLGVTEDYLATGTERSDEAATLVQAELALRLDEVDAATELYESALEKSDTPEERARALAGLGQVAFRRGDPRAAIGASRKLGPRRAIALSTSRPPRTRSGARTRWSTSSRLRLPCSTNRLRRPKSEATRSSPPGSRSCSRTRTSTRSASTRPSGSSSALGAGPDSRDPLLRARLYWSQSRLYTLQQQPDQAARYAKRALNILEATEHTEYTAKAHQLLAHIEIDPEHPEQALESVHRGLELLGEQGSPVDRALLVLEEARALVDRRARAGASLSMEAVGPPRTRACTTRAGVTRSSPRCTSSSATAPRRSSSTSWRQSVSRPSRAATSSRSIRSWRACSRRAGRRTRRSKC